MMPKLKLLDLYCCAGGAAAGYAQAGFEVTGVDIVHRKHYPYTFIQGDAIEYLLAHGHEYDFIHASPPCQAYSNSTATAKSKGATYPDLVAPTREALEKVGKPYVIENVMQAPLRADIVLRGDMFGLKTKKKRIFEIGNWYAMQPGIPKYSLSVKDGTAIIIYGTASWKATGSGFHGSPGRFPGKKPEWALKTIRETWAYAMGIDHYMTDKEIAESIPPAYARYIGEAFLNFLKIKDAGTNKISAQNQP